MIGLIRELNAMDENFYVLVGCGVLVTRVRSLLSLFVHVCRFKFVSNLVQANLSLQIFKVLSTLNTAEDYPVCAVSQC